MFTQDLSLSSRNVFILSHYKFFGLELEKVLCQPGFCASVEEQMLIQQVLTSTGDQIFWFYILICVWPQNLNLDYTTYNFVMYLVFHPISTSVLLYIYNIFISRQFSVQFLQRSFPEMNSQSSTRVFHLYIQCSLYKLNSQSSTIVFCCYNCLDLPQEKFFQL